jgi:hypothetical protein
MTKQAIKTEALNVKTLKARWIREQAKGQNRDSFEAYKAKQQKEMVNSWFK